MASSSIFSNIFFANASGSLAISSKIPPASLAAFVGSFANYRAFVSIFYRVF